MRPGGHPPTRSFLSQAWKVGSLPWIAGVRRQAWTLRRSTSKPNSGSLEDTDPEGRHKKGPEPRAADNGEETDPALKPKPLSGNGGDLQALTVRQGRIGGPQSGPLTNLPGKQHPTEWDFRDRWVIGFPTNKVGLWGGLAKAPVEA